MKYRILHISDTHGNFPKLTGKFDCVVHSGDFFPNSNFVRDNNTTREMAYQLDWLNKNIESIKIWLQNTPLLFCAGNHDFLHPSLMESVLNSEGINIINITNNFIEYDNINFYGFPYVPYINGMWNYEKQIPEMEIEVNKIIDILNTKDTHVLVTHAPIYKILDMTMYRDMIGSTIIANAFDYSVVNLPKCYLHGHCHEANGVSMYSTMLISNAAMTKNLIELNI